MIYGTYGRCVGQETRLIPKSSVVVQFGWHVPEALRRAWFSSENHALQRLRACHPRPKCTTTNSSVHSVGRDAEALRSGVRFRDQKPRSAPETLHVAANRYLPQIAPGWHLRRWKLPIRDDTISSGLTDSALLMYADWVECAPRIAPIASRREIWSLPC